MGRKLSVLVFLVCSTTTHALPFGFELGLGFSRSSRPGDNTTGLLAGISTDVAFGHHFGFTPEMNLFVPSGNVTYLTIPLLLRASLPLRDGVSLLALAGPSLGYRVTGATFNEFNAWLVVGLGAEVALSESWRLQLLVRHGLGLIDFTSAAGDDRLHYLQPLLKALVYF